ncbi:MAG: alpha/beta hydrolase [Verrucomicrobiaceae bacterium]|nr:alpha/beta hydrolase [Verrucomicrobiaceae bacterium]
MRLTLIFILLAFRVFSAEPEIMRDLFYTEAKNKLQALDVYSPAEGSGHPVVVWIHDGGWKKGDKATLQKKPQAFVEKGYVLVSINYRFVPEVNLKEMMGDIAKAFKWVRDHVAEHRGDPNLITVMGHSAGAHLAALICIDSRYLMAEGVPMESLKGCVPLDVSAYDVPKRLKDGGSVPPATIIEIFGATEAEQREFSPVYHIAKGKGIPPFLILHVASRDDTKAQAHWLRDKLADSGVKPRVVAAEGKTHGTISTDLGGADDAPTLELWKFLDEVMPRTGAKK